MKETNSRTTRAGHAFATFAAGIALSVAVLFTGVVASCASAPDSAGSAKGTTDAGAARGKAALSLTGAFLVGPAWLLAGYDTGAFFVPLEPGHGTSARIVFSADGTLAGTTGFSAFTGSWKAGKADGSGYVPVTLTARISAPSKAPNDTAVKFERDLLACFAATRLLKIEKDSFRLLDGQKRILLRYLSSPAR